MKSVIWVSETIFFLGFFHGLGGDHLLEILNSDSAPGIYEHPARISFKLGLTHISYILCLLIPLALFKIGIPQFSHFPFHIISGICFLVLGLYSFYEFFFRPPKLLHQHGHPHEHKHGHLHTKPLCGGSKGIKGDFEIKKDDTNQEKEHGSHLHGFPHNIDEPRSPALDHAHIHHHQHEHLHFHTSKEKQSHLHYHYSRFYKLLKNPKNLLLLLAISFTGLVFPFKEIFILLAAFFVGLYSSVYLLEVLYRGKGIKLLGEIFHVAGFFVGLIGVAGSCLFW